MCDDPPPNVTRIRPIPESGPGYALGLALHRYTLLDAEYHADLTTLSEADLRAIAEEFAGRTGIMPTTADGGNPC